METGSRKYSFVLVEEKEMQDPMDRDIRALLCECYPEDAGVYSQTRSWHGSSPVFSLVCVKKSVLAGYVGIVIREVARDSELLIVAGIQNLAVLFRFRGGGVGKEMVLRAQDEAERRGLLYGMLFCTPGLESFYVSMGWSRTAYRVTMDDLKGCLTPLPASLIPMVKVFGAGSFPPGDIYLRGPEW
ncbi:MAG TPA: GNAT family N-acetyltransferase [Spirochaetes bacterium]|nr:GNAT family N-acetyltransferase [Spirochaetota bacterium]